MSIFDRSLHLNEDTSLTNSLTSPKFHLSQKLGRFGSKTGFFSNSSLGPRKLRHRECRCQVAEASVSLAAFPRLSWTFCWTWRLREMTRSRLQRRIAARKTVRPGRSSRSHEEPSSKSVLGGIFARIVWVKKWIVKNWFVALRFKFIDLLNFYFVICSAGAFWWVL